VISGNRHSQVGHPQRGAAGRQGTRGKMYVLRRILAQMGTIDAIEFLLDKLCVSKTSSDFFDSTNT
jgi:transcription termination factor Rho